MEGGGAGVDGDGVAGADGSGKFLFKAADAGPGGQPARAQHGQRLVYLGLPKVGPKKWHRYLRRGAVLKMAGHAGTTRFAKVPAVDLPACPFPLAACPFRWTPASPWYKCTAMDSAPSVERLSEQA